MLCDSRVALEGRDRKTPRAPGALTVEKRLEISEVEKFETVAWYIFKITHTSHTHKNQDVRVNNVCGCVV